MVNLALDSESPLADPALMVLSNISRPSQLTGQVLSLMVGDEGGDTFDETKVTELLERIFKALTSTKYNTVGCNLHYLGPLLSNLSQLPIVRRHVIGILFFIFFTLNLHVFN